jgi:hypothetical protein
MVEPSSFLVVVADNGESIEKSSGRGAVPRFRYHCTPKRAPPETGRRGGRKSTNSKSWLKARSEEEAPAKKPIYLWTIVVITSIMVSRTQEVGHD